MGDMYNKLFTKILDSSIWLESMPTRLIWVTLIAAMDETGFCAFSAAQNLANRAIVPLEETLVAISTLEAPDINSADPDNDGRRIERVPGGWMVLNAGKYRDLVTKAIILEQTRERVRKHRSKSGNANVTSGNGSYDSDTASDPALSQSTGGVGGTFDPGVAFAALWPDYPKRVGQKAALRHFLASVRTDGDLADIRRALQLYKASKRVRDGFVQDGSRWFKDWRDWLDAEVAAVAGGEAQEVAAAICRCGHEDYYHDDRTGSCVIRRDNFHADDCKCERFNGGSECLNSNA